VPFDHFLNRFRVLVNSVVALLPGAHHYSGEYDKLAEQIAAFFEKILGPGDGAERRAPPVTE